MKSKREWPLTGVVDALSISRMQQKVSADRWQQVAILIKSKLNEKPPASFRRSLDRTLLTYHVVSALSQKSSPKKVRSHLKKFFDAAMRVNDSLNALDGTSAYLLEAISTPGISEMRSQIGNMVQSSHKALLAAQDPTFNSRLRDLSVLNMGSELADAVAKHFGDGMVVSTQDSLFVGLLEAMQHEATGREPQESGKAALRVVRFWRDSRRT
jgi:hypothetical protein